MARRLTGSQDLYGWSGKRPYASINFVTAHDGFTLHDLVSYNEKHNEANGEDNRDGHDNNLSWNCGVEGPTDDPDDPGAARTPEAQPAGHPAAVARACRCCWPATSAATPRTATTTPIARTTNSGWLDWTSTPERESLTTFVQRVIALRRAHPSFRRRNFFVGRPIEGDTLKDVSWLRPDGEEMTNGDWNESQARCLAMLVSGRGLSERGPRGEILVDDDFLLLFNSHHEDIPFSLPKAGPSGWALLIDTATGALPPEGHGPFAAQPPAWSGDTYPLQARSFVVLSRAGNGLG